jgi:DNA-binding response OmpR family regulator
MPGMNGLELLRILKEKFPDLKVFMITAYGDERTYQTARVYGADDYITKPVNFDTLKIKIINQLVWGAQQLSRLNSSNNISN